MNPFTSRTLLILQSWFLYLLVTCTCSALPPVILGLHGKHPLDEKQRATFLMGELRCAACHDGMPDAHMKLAPTLADAGSRLRAELMEEFIANPASTHHGTTMPDMLGAETDQSRKKIAAVITAFLLSLKGKLADPPSGEIDPYDGKEAFHSIGCVACHSPRDEVLREVIKEGVMPLTHLAGKYQPHALASFLHPSLA